MNSLWTDWIYYQCSRLGFAATFEVSPNRISRKITRRPSIGKVRFNASSDSLFVRKCGATILPMSPTLDPLLRGVAVGALCVTGLSIWRSEIGRSARLATLLASLSAAAWTLTEAEPTSGAVGNFLPLLILAFPVAGFFWLFVAVVFEDRPLGARAFAPSALFVIAGVAMVVAPPRISNPLGLAFNVASGLLCLHAAVLILRGWRDDLIEGRRRLRAPVVGFAAAFATAEASLGLLQHLMPTRLATLLSIRQVGGAAILALVAMAVGVLFLRARASLFPVVKAAPADGDPRAEAADRVLLVALTRFMDAGGWRGEGLTIARLARELGTPEHYLRRLINHGLGHRNFADFVNSHRVDAAKRRLSDPAEARTTIAVIAFDLGFGSLSTFNRAFRGVTGSTPTVWRREALKIWVDLEKPV
jgi:AraC-like DNA-binding protein